MPEKHFQQWRQWNRNTVTAFNLKLIAELLYPRFNQGATYIVPNTQPHRSCSLSAVTATFTLYQFLWLAQSNTAWFPWEDMRKSRLKFNGYSIWYIYIHFH
jgi:hypothetical protein